MSCSSCHALVMHSSDHHIGFATLHAEAERKITEIVSNALFASNRKILCVFLSLFIFLVRRGDHFAPPPPPPPEQRCMVFHAGSG